MSGASRPTRPYGSPLVLTSEESGGGFADRPTNPSGPDSACGTRGALLSAAADSRGGFHMRSSRTPRRSSSGYFSYDSESLPGSPLSPRPLTADKSTQTDSPCAQVIEYAVSSVAEGYGHEESAHQRQHVAGRSASSTCPLNSMRDMQAVLIGQELRRQGDEFNRLLTERRQAGGVRPQWRPQVQREHAVFICMGLLIFFFGRLLYSRGATFRQSQV